MERIYLWRSGEANGNTGAPISALTFGDGVVNISIKNYLEDPLRIRLFGPFFC